MSDDPLDTPLDVDLGKPAPPEPDDVQPRRAKPWLIVGGAAAVVLALAGGYIYLRKPPAPPAPAAAAPVAPPAAPSARGPEPGEQIPLPPLDETDALVRQLITRLSSHPTVAAWLTTDGLILNFAQVTRQISSGETPVQELGAVGPVPDFEPRTARGALIVDPASYRRYDRYAQAVAALDARGTARLYATLKPRIGDAYGRIGQPAGDFDAVLERAIVELLRVPIVHGEVELAPSGIVYAYVDPKLEGLSDAQKQLLRMGPQNVQLVQAKLREIADYLAIPIARLPPPSTMPE